MRSKWLLLASLLAAQTIQVQACQVEDFKVVGFKVAVRDDCTASRCPVLKLTGKLVNNCSDPAGANVQITAYNKVGEVVDVVEGWPASIRNIAPGKSLPFSLGPLMPYRDEMASFDIQVIDVKQW